MFRLLFDDTAKSVMVLDTSIWDMFCAWKTCVAENREGAGPFYDDEVTGEIRKAALEDKLRETRTGSIDWVIIPIVDG